MASATPVLPEVGSTIVPPRDSNPRLSASAIMDRPIRSFRLPPGLNHSSLAKIRPAPPEKRGSSTSGVSPIDSSSASPRRIVVVEEELKEYLLADDSKKKAPAQPGLRDAEKDFSRPVARGAPSSTR